MKRVLLLDDDIDLCEIMVEIIVELGAASCLAVHSLNELRDLTEDHNSFDLVLIDMNLGINSPTGVEAYTWLLEHGYNGRIVFLSGHEKNHPDIQMVLGNPGITVIQKPADANQIETLLR